MPRKLKEPKSKSPCQHISRLEAYKRFATHVGGTQSARHIKPLHWYIACRLVLEGGFHPDEITPRPPFDVDETKGNRKILHFTPDKAKSREQVVLGGLKTKNVDVVVTLPTLGPVIAISCKGVTKAFRNLTNRMEETIGECTNLHITYAAMVVGYLAVIRANRSVKDALEAPDREEEEPAAADAENGGVEAADASNAEPEIPNVGATPTLPAEEDLSKRKIQEIKKMTSRSTRMGASPRTSPVFMTLYRR